MKQILDTTLGIFFIRQTSLLLKNNANNLLIQGMTMTNKLINKKYFSYFKFIRDLFDKNG